ncbi:MAG: hypothetical protein HPY72_09515 [Anaerolineae bacterium]|nr:hypothetical protein [Anaerolineae bacterium]
MKLPGHDKAPRQTPAVSFSAFFDPLLGVFFLPAAGNLINNCRLEGRIK